MYEADLVTRHHLYSNVKLKDLASTILSRHIE